MTTAERQDLLWLIVKLKAHAASARTIGSTAEAESFEAKVKDLMTSYQVPDEELVGFDQGVATTEPRSPKLHCYRVQYALVTEHTTGSGKYDVVRQTQEKVRHVIATSELEASATVGLSVEAPQVCQVQQVSTLAKDVLLA